MGIRVLHLVDSGGLYGAERMLLDLVAEQQKAGLQPLILSAGTPDIEIKPLELEADRRGLPVRPFRMKAGLNFRKGMDVLRFAQAAGFDVLHSHGYKFNILLGSLPRRYRKIPLLTTVHGYVHAAPFSKMRLNMWLDRLCLRNMDAVVFVSEWTIRQTELALQNASVIDNGLCVMCDDETGTDGPDALDAQISAGQFVIGAFARLTAEKGLENLLAAVDRLSDSLPDILLVIWGEGHLRARLQAEIDRLKLNDRVVLPGYTQHTAGYMKMIDMLALPSLTEGLPMVLLEAMHHGTPVVASAVGAIPEVLDYGRCGTLVPPGDVEALAGAIEHVCRDRDDAARMADRGRERVMEKYTSRVMADRYLRLYEQLLAGIS